MRNRKSFFTTLLDTLKRLPRHLDVHPNSTAARKPRIDQGVPVRERPVAVEGEDRPLLEDDDQVIDRSKRGHRAAERIALHAQLGRELHAVAVGELQLSAIRFLNEAIEDGELLLCWHGTQSTQVPYVLQGGAA